MNFSLFQLLLLVLSVSSGAVLLAPGRSEQLSMMIHDGRFGEAVTEVSGVLLTGDAKPELLGLLALAHRGNGQPLEAALRLEEFLVSRPRDFEALKLLPSLYSDAGMAEEMLCSMERLESLTPTAEGASRLLAMLRLYGKVEAETTLMQRLHERRLLAPDMLRRLGELLAQRGDRSRAVNILAEALEHEGPAGAKTLLFIFELLVADGHLSEATDRVAAWVLLGRDVMLSIKVIMRLEALGDMEHAQSLLAIMADFDPGSRFFLARLLSEQHANASAAILLGGWIGKSKAPSIGEIGQFVSVARMTGVESLVWRAFAWVLCIPEALEAQAHLAEYIFDEFGGAGLAPFRPELSINALRQRPLFAAKLAIQEKEFLAATNYLLATNIGALSEEEQRYWFELLVTSAGELEALQILAEGWRTRELPPGLLASYAVLAARLELFPEYEKAVGELSRF